MRCLVALGCVALLARTATADPAAAAAASQEAERLAGTGDFTGALAKFREANRLDPRAEFVCDIGIAYRKAGDLPRAQRFLADCLLRATTFDAEFVTQLRAALTAVEDTLRAGDYTPVEIVADPAGAATTLDGDPDADALVGPRILWLSFGAHTALTRADGFGEHRTQITAAARARQTIHVALERASAPAAPPRVTQQPPAPPAVSAQAAPSRLPAIVALGTGGALVATSLALYLHARTVNDSAADATDRGTYQGRLDTASGYQHAAWAVGGAAILTAAVGGWLWLHAHPVEVSASQGGAAIAVSGRW